MQLCKHGKLENTRIYQVFLSDSQKTIITIHSPRDVVDTAYFIESDDIIIDLLYTCIIFNENESLKCSRMLHLQQSVVWYSFLSDYPCREVGT